jgi:hypothetical protein
MCLELIEVLLLARIDHLQAKALGEAGFLVRSLVSVGEIANQEAGGSDSDPKSIIDQSGFRAFVEPTLLKACR